LSRLNPKEAGGVRPGSALLDVPVPSGRSGEMVQMRVTRSVLIDGARFFPETVDGIFLRDGKRLCFPSEATQTSANAWFVCSKISEK
jgi:hypothetical protein